MVLYVQPEQLLPNLYFFTFFSFFFSFFLYSSSIFFHLLRDFYSIHVHTGAFCLFFLQKHFYFVHKHIIAFCFFLFLKDFDTFHEPFFEIFLCFSKNIQSTFLYRKEKIFKNISSVLYTLSKKRFYIISILVSTQVI